MPWNENCINIATNHYMEFFQACFVHLCPEEIKATISTSQLTGAYFKALDTPKWLQTHPKDITIFFLIGVIIWNEKNDFPALSRGDNGHWSVGNLICWYFIRHDTDRLFYTFLTLDDVSGTLYVQNLYFFLAKCAI